MKTIIIGVFLREQSALSEYFLTMANKFVKLGYRVIVISDENRNDLINMNSNPMILTWPSYNPTKWADFIFIKNIIQKYKPVMLIGNFASVNMLMIAGKFYGVPHRIAWMHSISSAFSGEVPQWKTLRKRFIYKFATNIIANSLATKVDGVETFSIDNKKIIVLYNLINNNDKYFTDNKDDSIIFVGRFHKSKGIDVLLKAIKIVKKSINNIKVNIVAGGDASEYKSMIKSLGIENNVSLLGRQPREKVIEYFAKAKISVVPSYFEAFGYTVVESLSVKTPVIGSNTGGIAEIIDDGVNGLLFDVGDYETLADKILLLYNDDTLYEKIREFSLQSFYKKYSLDYCIDQHISKLEQLLIIK